MSLGHNIEQEGLTEHLALALCMQLSSDYSDLMKRLNISDDLTLRTYKRAGLYLNSKVMDPNAAKLQDSIIRNYSKYAKFLEGRTYSNGEEKQA